MRAAWLLQNLTRAAAPALRNPDQLREVALWGRHTLRGTRDSFRRVATPAMRPWVIGLIIAALACGLRIVRLAQAFEVYYDEAVYLHISQNLANGLGLTFDGKTPVFLHPPLFFMLEGLYVKILPLGNNVVQQIQTARYINVALASCTAVVLFQIARNTGSRLVGVATAGLFALDPFAISINSRNLLQTSAMLYVLVGYWCTLCALQGSRSRRYAMAAGCTFGMALLTNEVVAFITVLPLGWCLAFGWGMPRRLSLLSTAIATGTYALYPIWAALTGQWDAYSGQKLTGILRFTGAVQKTGFNRPNGPKFGNAVAVDFGQLATTYVIIATGALALCYLLARREPTGRLLGLWTASAYCLLGYSVKFGTNEAQYFYYLVVPAMLATVVGLDCALRAPLLQWRVRAVMRARCPVDQQFGARRGPAASADFLGRALLALIAALYVAWTGYQWTTQHFTADNGYEHLFKYLDKHIPPGARIALTTVTSSTLNYLEGSPYPSGPWGTPNQVLQQRARYVLVSTELIAKGYDSGTPALLTWLQHRGSLVFRFHGPSDGDLELFRVTGPLRGAGTRTTNRAGQSAQRRAVRRPINTNLPLATRVTFGGLLVTNDAHTDLTLVNPQRQTVNARLALYFESGAQLNRTMTINASSRRTIDLRTMAPNRGSFGLSLRADRPLAAFATLQRSGAAGDLLLTNQGVSPAWTLQENYTGLIGQETLSILNPDPSHTVRVTLQMRPLASAAPATLRLSVLPHSIAITQLQPLQATSVMVAADRPVAVAQVPSFSAAGYGLAMHEKGDNTATNWIAATSGAPGKGRTIITLFSPSCAATLSSNVTGGSPSDGVLLAARCRTAYDLRRFVNGSVHTLTGAQRTIPQGEYTGSPGDADAGSALFGETPS